MCEQIHVLCVCTSIPVKNMLVCASSMPARVYTAFELCRASNRLGTKHQNCKKIKKIDCISIMARLERD
jgi:hypothetical protein